jgi:hypothetical protein
MKNVDNKDIIRDSYLLKVKLKLPFSNFWDVEMELFGLYYRIWAKMIISDESKSEELMIKKRNYQEADFSKFHSF